MTQFLLLEAILYTRTRTAPLGAGEEMRGGGEKCVCVCIQLWRTHYHATLPPFPLPPFPPPPPFPLSLFLRDLSRIIA